MADQLTLFVPGWADFAPHTIASPPGFKKLSTPQNVNYLPLIRSGRPKLFKSSMFVDTNLVEFFILKLFFHETESLFCIVFSTRLDSSKNLFRLSFAPLLSVLSQNWIPLTVKYRVNHR